MVSGFFKNKRYRTLLRNPFFVSSLILMIFSLMRGINNPLQWAITTHLVNYDRGLIRRGLIGTIHKLIDFPFMYTETFFTVIGAVLLALNFGFILRVIYQMNKKEVVALNVAGLIIASSLVLVLYSHAIGYLHHVGLLFSLIILQIKNYRTRLVLFLVLFFFMIFIYETNFIVWFPMILSTFLILIHKKPTLLKYGQLIAISAFLFGTFIFLVSRLLSLNDAQYMFFYIQNNAGFIEDKVVSRNVYYFLLNLTETFKLHGIEFLTGRKMELFRDLWVVLPSVLFFQYLSFKLLVQQNINRLTKILFFVAPYSSLSLCLVGWDIHLWAHFPTMVSFLGLYFLQSQYKFPDNFKPKLIQWLPILIFLLAINLNAQVPLFPDYSIRHYPFW